MRWTHIIILSTLFIALVASIAYPHKDRVIVLRTPPASLAQWYKPQSQRQVWLHNMFKLRREMQAVRLYSATNDAEHLNKWASRLAEDYVKIGEMVPEWQRKLDTQAIANLQSAVNKHDYQNVGPALDALGRSCESCHKDYQTLTATLYRAPDFSSIGDIRPETSFNAHMNKLTEQVNQIKIASEDGLKTMALASLSDLEKGIDMLGETCVSCHIKDKQTYPGDTIKATIARLEESLRTGDLKDQGRELGTLAVTACARCHGTHRLSYQTRRLLGAKPDWLELIKH